MAAREEQEQLLNHAMEFAQQCVTKYGGFSAFAGALGTDGKAHAIAADPRADTSDEKAEVDDDHVREMLIAELKEGAAKGEFKATFICYNARVADEKGKQTDTIAVSIEHKDSAPLMLYLPYKKKFFGGYSYGELNMQQGAPKIFV